MAVAGVMTASAQFTPNKIVVPDIEGYKTLTGDFHIHTVFSDASVWPSTRVQEAIWEGLDVIAITEHIDTRHQKMVNNGTFVKGSATATTLTRLQRRPQVRISLLFMVVRLPVLECLQVTLTASL